MNKTSVFVLNRLKKLDSYCKVHPIKFKFCAGVSNPADAISRCKSFKTLMKTNYLTGPIENNIIESDEIFSIEIPINTSRIISFSITETYDNANNKPLFSEDRFSTLKKDLRVMSQIFRAVRAFGCKLNISNNFASAYNYIIKTNQLKYFNDEYTFLKSKSNKNLSSIPNLIKQLNIYLDKNGILRVKGKLDREHAIKTNFPI